MTMLKAMTAGMAAILMLGGCGSENPSELRVQRQITVSGAPEDVERFAKLQHSIALQASLSEFDQIENGKVSLSIELPQQFTEDDLIQITREALAAGLSYEV